MKERTVLTTILALVFLLFLANSVQAGDEAQDNFYGGFMLGYRNVDVTGVETKYKEDINLESGPRLFNFHLHYLPEGKLKKIVDRIDLTVYNYGGDPFETLSLSVVKYGMYNLTYNRRKSTYFYQDILEGHDYHHFDFDRVIDDANLKIWLGKRAHLNINFNRFTKTGSSTTTLDISHEEYEFDKPVNESSYDIGVGFDYNLPKISFVVEQRYQEYNNEYSMFLPGRSQGEGTDDFIELYYFFMDQPYDFTNWTTNLKINWRPSDRFLMKAAAQLNDQKLNFDYSERAEGVAYTGAPLMYESGGTGDFTRKLQLVDVDATYLFNYKFAAVAAVRYHNFDQDGSTDIDGETATNMLAFNTLGIEAGLQYQVSSKFGLAIGYRNETRDVEMMHGDETDTETTKRTGFFGNVNVTLSRAFSLVADYQMGTYTDPFTFVSPEDFHRFRLTLKYSGKRFWVRGSYMLRKSTTSVPSDWSSDRNQFNLRAGYRGKTFKFSLGYNWIDIMHEGTREIEFSYGPAGSWDILYEGTSHLIDASLFWNASKNWGLGAYVNSYTNKGTWGIERLMAKAFVDYTFDEGVVVRLAYRYVDFKETLYGYNDYKANILEFGVGYRW